MQKLFLIVFALTVLNVIRVSGSEPTIEFSFRGPKHRVCTNAKMDDSHRTVMGLGEETLESILVPEQIVALKQLGKSDYRITLSLARQALTPASKQK